MTAGRSLAPMNVSRRRFLQCSTAAATLLHERRVFAADRRRLNPWRSEPMDLRRFMRVGVDHIFQGAVDRRRGCLPFVRFNLTDSPTWARHEYWGSPHMVGRFLDALALCAEIIDVPPDDQAIDGLRTLLHDCLANPPGLPFDALPWPDGKKGAAMHHCREVLLALLGLSKWRKCERSAALARDLVRTIERVTRDTGCFPGPSLRESGWAPPEPGQLNTTTGRLIGALVACYRDTKDDLAIDLARWFADVNIEKTFTTDGELTEAAGTHLHSTEGTMASLLDLGVVTGDERYSEIGRRLYDVGLKRWRTSYGWAKESRDQSAGRGEANNTGDFIAAALTLALQGRREYFADAERFIRNGLLAAQIIDTDWIVEAKTPDTDDYVYSDLRTRARGAFAFTTPNGYHSYNTDLMGGALRALCQAWHASVTTETDGCHVNMLFTTESSSLTVRSLLPDQGRIEIRTRRPCRLFVRMPDGVSQQKVESRVGGQPRQAQWNLPELSLGEVPADTEVTISFPIPRRSTQEPAPGEKTPYEIDWLGDTIIAMRPSQGAIALY